MPIYMDRHDVSETVTAENVAQLHQEDLKIQHEFECRGLTYWFDEKRKTAFCLIEAPNEQSLKQMHDKAHGEVPHEIIEVDTHIVESFLGRIEDPETSKNTDLNIINDPAFRTLMRIRLNYSTKKLDEAFENDIKSITNLLNKFDGRIVKHNADGFLVSFQSVSQAIKCAIEIQFLKKKTVGKIDGSNLELKIGLSAGVPIAGGKTLFEDTIKLAERMSHVGKGKIVVSSEIKDLYKSENSNVFIETEHIFVLSSSEEVFLNHLIDFTEKEWGNPDLKIEDFHSSLGHSKSQLYRKMIALVGESPNSFLKEYRLGKALEMMNKTSHTISEIAFSNGFSSLSYFSKCFQKRYDILPSELLKTQN